MADNFEEMGITELKIDKGIDLDDLQAAENKRILVVDDDPKDVTLLKRVLINEGYNVSGARSGSEALQKLNEVKPDLIILDLLMPGMNGEETLKAIHQQINIPVIMVSAVDRRDEIVRMLHNGVDDYITKPFDEGELLARVVAVLRRSENNHPTSAAKFPSLDLVVNFDSYEVIYHKSRIQLTGKMFEVLEILARNAPRVVNYQELTTRIWEENTPPVRNRLKYLIYLLRQEFLKIDPATEVIENIDRLGYKLCSDR